MMGQYSYFCKQRRDSTILSEYARKKLIKTIVEWSVRKCVWIALKDYPTVFLKIKGFFPNEKMSLYFIPKGPGNAYPSGNLYNHFRRRHKLFRMETGIRKNQSSEKEPQSTPWVFQISKENANLVRQRLISRSEPWEEILDDWKQTFEYRRVELKEYSFAEFLNRWPKFNHKRGMEMVIICLKFINSASVYDYTLFFLN